MTVTFVGYFVFGLKAFPPVARLEPGICAAWASSALVPCLRHMPSNNNETKDVFNITFSLAVVEPKLNVSNRFVNVAPMTQALGCGLVTFDQADLELLTRHFGISERWKKGGALLGVHCMLVPVTVGHVLLAVTVQQLLVASYCWAITFGCYC